MYCADFIRLLVLRILDAIVKLSLPTTTQNQGQTFVVALIHDLKVHIANKISFLNDLAQFVGQ
jgi:hypothetical protein